LRRMAVSIILAAENVGLSTIDAQDVVLNFLDSYIYWMNIFTALSYDPRQISAVLVELNNTNGVVNELIHKVAGKDRASFLSKYTMINSTGNHLFQNTPELQPISSDTYAAISDAMTFYIDSHPWNPASYYMIKDICQKFGSGTGSLGRYRYYLLIEGPSPATDDDLILEMKQETSTPDFRPTHGGERVSLFARKLGNTDPSLGYTTVNDIDFFVREKSPFQKDFDYTKLTTKTLFMDAMGYAGKVVAKAHSLSAEYYWGFDVQDIIRGRDAELKNEIVNFAVDYAIQVEYDYASFIDALNRGVHLY